ncbi:DUF2254 domain-containing protein [Neorhodopirellula pilleata]|uniref:DUF2254 domain-containing protein n=1 Tax=Neorhodopirellula pilleata TaxID=2714738 RepID=A0A5C6ARN7_9BACT|nr:DUF2254 domain-containing protein [Neorhodopirellula pilleata]TWU01746.1 hypothetical protein Pla100_14810 [Neorhodopirellula pilleata]
MRAYLQQLTYSISGSYWFIPSLMVLAAVLLSQGAIQLDRAYGSDWMAESWWASLNQPDGARALLATVAGSMITVAGTTFSLTILAVSHATSHFGPRLLDNFMRDRGNQITLGTFVATFIYCLLVLRVIRGSSESVDAFVPQLSLFLALLLTLASVAELIYFIHHIPESIHISNVLQRMNTQMLSKFDELYPATIGDAAETRAPAYDFQVSHKIASSAHGYLQGVDEHSLMAVASDSGRVLRLRRRPGDFVRVGELIAEVDGDGEWDDADDDRVRAAFAFGVSRNPTQDVFFVLDQFVEVAMRALSPGVNDPFTAMQCMDHLSVGLVELSRRQLPSDHRVDNQGIPKIITTEVTLEQFAVSMLDQVFPYAAEDANAANHYIETLKRVIEISDNAELNDLITARVQRMQDAMA